MQMLGFGLILWRLTLFCPFIWPLSYIFHISVSGQYWSIYRQVLVNMWGGMSDEVAIQVALYV
jgi:hypothetical protein